MTFNKHYLFAARAMLRSLVATQDDDVFLRVISNDVCVSDLKPLLRKNDNVEIFPFDEKLLARAPTSKRYPQTIYHRIFASEILPADVDKILYLDPDIIVKGKLNGLYETPLGDNLFAAATNTSGALLWFNNVKNRAPKRAVYPNTGVLLLNLVELRKTLKVDDVFDYIKRNGWKFCLPDEDVLNGLYGDRIVVVDKLKYNLADRTLTKHNIFCKDKIDGEWVEKNTVIVHYLGRNKPWKANYRGILKKYYDKYADK